MIEKWEFYPRDRRYLSAPMEQGRRYRIFKNHGWWTAQYIRYQTQILMGNVLAYVGSYKTPAEAMRACQKHDMERCQRETA